MRRKLRGYSVSRAVLNLAHWFLHLSIPTQSAYILHFANTLASGPSFFGNNETSKGLCDMSVSQSYPGLTDPGLIC